MWQPPVIYAVRFFVARSGHSAIVYRRRPTAEGQDHLKRVARLSPLALDAGAALLRQALLAAGRNGVRPGPARSLDADWGPRIACYALVTEGLRDLDALTRAAAEIRVFSGDEAAWWLGQITGPPERGMRARRALRILIGAVR